MPVSRGRPIELTMGTGAIQQLLNPFAGKRLEIFLILEQETERVLDRFPVEFRAIERHKRRDPVEGLRDARRLVQLRGPQFLDERRDLFRESCRRIRYLRRHDGELFVEVWVVDPMIETPALQ